VYSLTMDRAVQDTFYIVTLVYFVKSLKPKTVDLFIRGAYNRVMK